MVSSIVLAMALQDLNTLTNSEKRQGWELLFDGKTTNGWHGYKHKAVGSGWVVKDGVLSIADAHNAGDIVTDKSYKWFELQIEYNMGKGQNAGIMFHVGEDDDYPWMSGPEIQLYDNIADPNGQLAGWLYDLVKSPIDATKPPGEWNKLRIIIAPKKCETFMNGKKYYDFVLGSDDFKARVEKSKFGKMPNFAKLGQGGISIQGDHGLVSYRNIKIREIKERS